MTTKKFEIIVTVIIGVIIGCLLVLFTIRTPNYAEFDPDIHYCVEYKVKCGISEVGTVDKEWYGDSKCSFGRFENAGEVVCVEWNRKGDNDWLRRDFPELFMEKEESTEKPDCSAFIDGCVTFCLNEMTASKGWGGSPCQDYCKKESTKYIDAGYC